MASIKIPKSVCTMLVPSFIHDPEGEDVLSSIRGSVRAMVEKAAADGLSPAELPISTEPGVTLNLTFAGATQRAISLIRRERDCREGDAMLGLLYAGLARGDAANYTAQAEAAILKPYLEVLGLEERHHQSLFAEYIHETLEGTEVGFVEGATGLGKTLAIVGACARLLEAHRGRRCVVTVPTIQLVAQYAKQHRTLSERIEGFPVARVVVGRGSFVSATKVLTLLEEGHAKDCAAAIRAWLDEGGPAIGARSALALPYLEASLLEICPQFAVDEVKLSSDTNEDDAGERAYRRQFSRDETAGAGEIVYCTHAMVAADLRRRMMGVRRSEEGVAALAHGNAKVSEAREDRARASSDSGLSSSERSRVLREAGSDMRAALERQLELLTELAASMDVGLLPPFEHLVVDEAHLFEGNLANLMAFNVSLSSYVRHLALLSDAGLITGQALKRSRAAIKVIRDAPDRDDYELSDAGETVSNLRAALAELAAAFYESKRLAGKNGVWHPVLPLASAQALAISSALRAASTPAGARAVLSYSPVKAFPQLMVGRRSVGTELAFLWGTLISSACISATLYLRKLDKDSAAYMASVLNVPVTRRREFGVVRPPWVFEPVMGLYTPEAEMGRSTTWLRPPSRKDQLGPKEYAQVETRWLDELAAATRHIHRTAAGGVLVLLGSYHAATELGKRLEDIEYKVIASQRAGVAEQRRTFVEMRQSGNKALWVGVGAAWTGVDVNGADFGIEDPSEDNLLTDLVIGRLPFGVNRSMTHKTRVERNTSVPWELLETAMRFKQGIGRLVRRPGLARNRRIFVLDGRLNDPTFAHYLSHIRRIMGAYPAKALREEDVRGSFP